MSIKHALLGMLEYAPSYGYQLRGKLKAILGDPWLVNVGQIYSTLSRLERDGLVIHRPDAIGKADARTVYSLTKEGKSELERWFLEPLSRAYRLRDGIYAKLMLSRFSSAVSPRDVIQSQRRLLLSEMHDITEARSQADPEFELPWILLLESAIMHLEADLRWLALCEDLLEKLDKTPAPQYKGRPRGRPRGKKGRSKCA